MNTEISSVIIYLFLFKMKINIILFKEVIHAFLIYTVHAAHQYFRIYMKNVPQMSD